MENPIIQIAEKLSANGLDVTSKRAVLHVSGAGLENFVTVTSTPTTNYGPRYQVTTKSGTVTLSNVEDTVDAVLEKASE